MDTQKISRLNEFQRQFLILNDQSAEIEDDIDSLIQKLKQSMRSLVLVEAQEKKLDDKIEKEKIGIIRQISKEHDIDIDLLTSIEKDRLVIAAQEEDYLLVDWLISKKKLGVSFDDLKTPLQKLLKEDFNNFVRFHKQND